MDTIKTGRPGLHIRLQAKVREHGLGLQSRLNDSQVCDDNVAGAA